MNITHMRNLGYSVIELMVALVIGLILMIGVMSVFVTSRGSFDASEVQARMADDGRFVMSLLGTDIRMAGSWGQNSHTSTISNRLGGLDPVDNDFDRGDDLRGDYTPGVDGIADCATDFFIDMDDQVRVWNDTNPFSATCIPPDAEYLRGDVVMIRYAEPEVVADDDTADDILYVRSEPGNSVLFIGTGNVTGVPNDPVNGQNHRVRIHIYYLSAFTEVSGDGIPSLHRLTLEEGPRFEDEMLVSGVENFQVQLGFDRTTPQPNGIVNSYLHADSTEIDWTDPVDIGRVRAINMWFLLRSENPQKAAPAPAPIQLAGNSYTPQTLGAAAPIPNYRHMVINSVFELRNYPAQNSGS